MISAREFCREPDYPITLFLTYSFDPLFFERVALRDLEIGGSRRIVIAADAEQVAEAMNSCIGQVFHLGRRYALAETVVPNTFHPKLIARLSAEGGRVWLGSGNLTYTGWGGNRELASAWSIGPGQEDSGVWLDELLGAVSTLVRSTTFAAQIEFMRHSIPWLKVRTDIAQKYNVLFGMPDRPLAPQLGERWKERRFTKLMLCTGSTDIEGAFLSWTHRTFGIEHATICLSPPFASFDPALLAKLPLDVRIIKADPKQLMHAKFYWFSGPDGNAAVVGSANCSAAAWLASRGFGNVELIVPYDDARADDFKSILETFDAPHFAPAEVLVAKPPKSAEVDGQQLPAYRIVSLRLRSTGRIIEAVIEPPVDAGDQVNLELSAASGSVTIKLAPQADRLTGRLPPDFEIGSITPFARAEVISGQVRYITAYRWVDNEAVLDRTNTGGAIDPNLLDLSRQSLLGADQHKILEAVYAVSAQLLRGDDENPIALATVAGSGPAAKGKDAAEDLTRAVDPAAIVRSLKELSSERWAKERGHASPYGGTLEGVIGMLFSRDAEAEIDLSRETWTGDSEQEADRPEGAQSHDRGAAQPASQDMPATSAETFIGFREQIDYFLHELAQSSFAETCDARRMVQALAFPLLLCVRGTEAGWLPHGMLPSVAARVIDIMLNQPYGPGRPQGLFRHVQGRYAALGKQNDFLRAVGEGTLWAALIASLSSAEPAPFKYLIRYASAIAAVFGCKELVAVADAEQLSALVPGLIIKDAEFALTHKAGKIADALAALTKALLEQHDTINQEQGRGRFPQTAGSVLWSPNWGWKILPGSPAEIYCAGYINVEAAASKHQEIQEAIDALLESMAIAPNAVGNNAGSPSNEAGSAVSAFAAHS